MCIRDRTHCKRIEFLLGIVVPFVVLIAARVIVLWNKGSHNSRPLNSARGGAAAGKCCFSADCVRSHDCCRLKLLESAAANFGVRCLHLRLLIWPRLKARDTMASAAAVVMIASLGRETRYSSVTRSVNLCGAVTATGGVAML